MSRFFYTAVGIGGIFYLHFGREFYDTLSKGNTTNLWQGITQLFGIVIVKFYATGIHKSADMGIFRGLCINLNNVYQTLKTSVFIYNRQLNKQEINLMFLIKDIE